MGFAFFTIATILGAFWAAEAWGGYWSWDPVENASFLPWLTPTAALHAAMTVVDGTESVLDRAIVRLAASAIWGESVRAERAAADAFDLLDGTGIRATGWERMFAALTA